MFNVREVKGDGKKEKRGGGGGGGGGGRKRGCYLIIAKEEMRI